MLLGIIESYNGIPGWKGPQIPSGPTFQCGILFQVVQYNRYVYLRFTSGV